MSTITALETIAPKTGASRPMFSGTGSGSPRDFLDNRFVYVVLSPRAGGLTIGINLNPDKACNFNCVYCEVNRNEAPRESIIDADIIVAELKRTLETVFSGALRERTNYRTLPADLLKLRHLALSGDGEPTLCPQFSEIVEKTIHVRACGRFPFFKLVLLTNASALDRKEVLSGLRHFTIHDEIWAKLEAGTQEAMDRIYQVHFPIETILANILALARQRPVIIQSLFPSIGGTGPSASEIDAYAARLNELKANGAQIPLVQIYSASRPSAHPESGHLPLRTLKEIARKVREVTGLKAEVF
ncbi:MAG: Radical superfamily protein [Verrucomicrobiales bacterium]|nr:Radical superfamily protein [Verrucomicrobiales bacterium]